MLTAVNLTVPCDWFGRQELPRLVLVSLRGAGQPLSPAEIAREVMTCKGMVVADQIRLEGIEYLAASDFSEFANIPNSSY